MGEFSYCWVNHHWFVIVAFWHSTYNSTFCLFLHSWNIMTLEEIQKSCHNLVSGTWQTRLAYRHTKIIVSFSQWILILFISMQKVINGSKVRYWACINFSRNVQQRTANAFCQQLVQACQTLGMVKFQVFGYPWQLFYNYVIGTNYMLPFIIVVYIFSIHDLFILSQEFSQEPVIPVYSARPDMVKKALKYVHSTSINKLDGKELELLIAILPDNNGSLYGIILRYSSTLYYFIFRRICFLSWLHINMCCSVIIFYLTFRVVDNSVFQVISKKSAKLI
jgi:hypothetical protein